jgi:hypothetical protein
MMSRDRVMQILGFAFGLALAMPASAGAGPSERSNDVAEDQPIERVEEPNPLDLSIRLRWSADAVD